jgi:DNA-binding XRE family transcriptional regulator
LGERLLRGLHETKAHYEGKSTGVKLSYASPRSAAIAKLKAARLAAGLTLAQVAKVSGVRLETLSRMELGKAQNPTLDTLQNYAAAVGMVLRIEVDVK